MSSTHHLTVKTLSKLQPTGAPYIIRDSVLRGFGVKVNPTGSVKFIAEVWHNGRSVRKTIGDYPILSIQDARTEALSVIGDIKSGALSVAKKEITLKKLFRNYIAGDRLKPRTVTDYKEAINFYLQDWLNKPVSSITKEMVEKRFYQIRDKGIAGGKPTYSQATKTMRILSALMNYARADDLIESNPVEVLKLKRVDRSLRKREHYLKAEEVKLLLSKTAQDTHPMTLAIHLMLYSGLRKNEALRLKWDDLEVVNTVECLLIKDTKNHRPHYVPITPTIQEILDRAKNHSEFLFPSPQKPNSHIVDERPTIQRLTKELGITFRCHDLRRTFATRASEVGIDHLMIKRLLNHKTNDITAQYIQWHSRDNLIAARSASKRIQY